MYCILYFSELKYYWENVGYYIGRGRSTTASQTTHTRRVQVSPHHSAWLVSQVFFPYRPWHQWISSIRPSLSIWRHALRLVNYARYWSCGRRVCFPGILPWLVASASLEVWRQLFNTTYPMRSFEWCARSPSFFSFFFFFLRIKPGDYRILPQKSYCCTGYRCVGVSGGTILNLMTLFLQTQDLQRRTLQTTLSLKRVRTPERGCHL